jgi:hypothetical protein
MLVLQVREEVAVVVAQLPQFKLMVALGLRARAIKEEQLLQFISLVLTRLLAAAVQAAQDILQLIRQLPELAEKVYHFLLVELTTFMQVVEEEVPGVTVHMVPAVQTWGAMVDFQTALLELLTVVVAAVVVLVAPAAQAGLEVQV